jgi:hypothetical protein
MKCIHCKQNGVTDFWHYYAWPLKAKCRLCGAKHRAVLSQKWNIAAQLSAQVVLWSVFIVLATNGLLIAFIVASISSIMCMLPFMKLSELKLIE